MYGYVSHHYIMLQGCCIMSKVEKSYTLCLHQMWWESDGLSLQDVHKIHQGSVNRTVGVNVSLFLDPCDKAAAAAAAANNSSSCQQKIVILSDLR